MRFWLLTIDLVRIQQKVKLAQTTWMLSSSPQCLYIIKSRKVNDLTNHALISNRCGNCRILLRVWKSKASPSHCIQKGKFQIEIQNEKLTNRIHNSYQQAIDRKGYEHETSPLARAHRMTIGTITNLWPDLSNIGIIWHKKTNGRFRFEHMSVLYNKLLDL